MILKRVGLWLFGVACGIALATIIYTFWSYSKMTKVHTLRSPLTLVSNEPAKSLYLLPSGTTMYFDRSFPEGITRYKVYINVDRMPLQLRELQDPTEIDPIEARPFDGSQLSQVLRDYPLNRKDLEAILNSKSLTKEEVKEVFETYLATNN